tara:strand:- start:1406 stop:1846 length:441 start_codon:yes stop_codon:yes gene_type:complete
MIIVRGCRYPANYWNVSYPLYSSPHGGIFIEHAKFYQDYEDLLNKRLYEERVKREAEFKEFNEKRARDFWSRYFQGFYGAPQEEPEEQKQVDYPYSVFGLKRSASNQDMKQAYRQSVLKAHPDKGGSNELFRKVQEAYNYFRNLIS